jgi:4-hydroxybenzoate polyprenyltransferase
VHYLAWCLVEARPSVLVIYTMRFLVAVALTMVAAPLATAPWWRLPTALAVWLCVAASVYLFDGVTDVVGDRVNGSRRPIARGVLPVPVAAAVAAVWAGLAVVGAVGLGHGYLTLVCLALLLGWAYSAPPLRLKRWTWSAGATVILAGLLTFTAGAVAVGATSLPTTLLLFAIAMSCWMGFVGALAKDLSDVAGDVATGRRSSAVVRGLPAAGRRLSGNALLVAATFVIAAAAVDRVLLWPAAAVLAGAVAIALTCRDTRLRRATRGPYRIFMTTQYVAHGVVPIGIGMA